MTDKEKVEYLIEKMRIIGSAIDNHMPSEALLEVRRTIQTIDSWPTESEPTS